MNETYSNLVDHIFLHLHYHPVAEHGCPTEAVGGCQNELVVDESPPTLTTLDVDENHPWHRVFCCVSTNYSITITWQFSFLFFFFLSLFFLNKCWLALGTFLHGSAASVEIFTNPIDFIIFTTDVLTIEIKVSSFVPLFISPPSIGEGEPYEENDCKY